MSSACEEQLSALQSLKLNVDILGIVGNPQMSVLNRPLQTHAGIGQRREGANAFHWEEGYGQVLQSIE